jgi:monofunctional glycosyltransferase
MKPLARWLVLFLIAGCTLEVFFIARIALAATIDPQSTAFQRSEAWRLATRKGAMRWKQDWVPYSRISDSLKRAVIASEDDGFATHDGVDWDAMEKAWQRNAQAEERAAVRRASTKPPKIVGGSTITQQLAKNLLLSGERTLLRKGQEIILTFALERMLSKERILEIYLNSVEWGEGVFGAEAAARHHFGVPAAALTREQSAWLAAILPSPRRYERGRTTPYVEGRVNTILARAASTQIP